MKDAFVECENPNDMLYRFEGTMGLGGDKKGALVPLGPDQILLRGSSMRNTETAYGLVVFTGHETKIMKNSVKSRAKFSKLELSTNNYIFMIVLLQFLISLIGAIFNTVWTEVYDAELRYYLNDPPYKPTINFFVQLGTWFLMIVNIVPISLMVTLEIVKFVQGNFIQWDHTIYDISKDMSTKA